MTGTLQTRVSVVPAEDAARHVHALGALLHDCVRAGASINFVLPFTVDEGEAFWRTSVLPKVQAGTWTLWIAWAGERIVGSVQLDCDTPPNQAHRAEVSKLLVHPDVRRRGIARALMATLEQSARAKGRSLITLDTRTGDAAERLYASLGFSTAGTIPGYCRDPFEDRLDSTTVMYKRL